MNAEIHYPAQCDCGHIFLERYQFQQPTQEGVIGFCWCGFCQTRRNVIAARAALKEPQ